MTIDDKSLEIVRQVIDMREQLHKLSEETGLFFMITAHDSYRSASVSRDDDGANFFSLQKQNGTKEDISLLWYGDRESDRSFDNLTQVDLDLLEVKETEGDSDDLDE